MIVPNRLFFKPCLRHWWDIMLNMVSCIYIFQCQNLKSCIELLKNALHLQTTPSNTASLSSNKKDRAINSPAGFQLTKAAKKLWHLTTAVQIYFSLMDGLHYLQYSWELLFVETIWRKRNEKCWQSLKGKRSRKRWRPRDHEQGAKDAERRPSKCTFILYTTVVRLLLTWPFL